MGPGVRRDDGGWGGSAIKSHPQSRSRGVRPAAARIRSPRTRSDPVRSSPPPQPSGPATTYPIRHPGERRDPWLRRTRRSRAAITRSATMGPGVRRDDGKGRRHQLAPAPATTRPHPVILAKARIQSRKRNPLRLWILGRAQDDGRGGRNMSLNQSIARPPRLAHPPQPAPPVIPAKAGTQSPKCTRPRP